MFLSDLNPREDTVGRRLLAQQRAPDVEDTLQRHLRLQRPTKLFCMTCGQTFVYTVEGACPECGNLDLGAIWTAPSAIGHVVNT